MIQNPVTVSWESFQKKPLFLLEIVPLLIDTLPIPMNKKKKQYKSLVYMVSLFSAPFIFFLSHRFTLKTYPPHRNSDRG